MSQSHIRRLSPPRRNIKVEIAIAVGFLCLVALGWAIQTGPWLPPDYDTTPGTVLDTRIVTDHIRETEFGGSIFYRFEARVRYQIPDQYLDRSHIPAQGDFANTPPEQWLTASDITTSRELLIVMQRKQSKVCRVYWIPHRPETAKCSFN